MNVIDDFLNKITMYRLVLYILLIWVFIGFIYSIFGIFPFNFGVYIFSTLFILLVTYLSNYILAKIFKIPTNIESALITGLILFLIISPTKDIYDLGFIAGIATLSSFTKYILAINKKHIFNPVAISVFVGVHLFKLLPSWWVGNIWMFPFIAIGGFLIVKKIRRWDLVTGFLVAVFLTISPLHWQTVFKDTTLLFFTSIMLLEPLTTPPTRILRIAYGGIVGILFYTQTPEMALIVGNIFSYIVSPKFRLMLSLKEKIKISPDTYDFIFTLNKPIKFTPGQYMEFTFNHPHADSRGNRRYFSLANSPAESEIRLGIKIGEPASSYKRNLLALTPSQKIAAGQLIGDFTLPKDQSKKLVLIAGGIGITPYRSILKHLIDTNQKRDIVVIYTASSDDEFVYRDVLAAAQEKLGIRTVYVNTKTQGHMDSISLAKAIPDFRERTFYISGSHGVVISFENMVKSLNVGRRQIVTDFFPGYV